MLLHDSNIVDGWKVLNKWKTKEYRTKHILSPMQAILVVVA